MPFQAPVIAARMRIRAIDDPPSSQGPLLPKRLLNGRISFLLCVLYYPLQALCDEFNDLKSIDKIATVQAKVDAVTGVMQKNIEMALKNTDRLVVAFVLDRLVTGTADRGVCACVVRGSSGEWLMSRMIAIRSLLGVLKSPARHSQALRSSRVQLLQPAESRISMKKRWCSLTRLRNSKTRVRR